MFYLPSLSGGSIIQYYAGKEIDATEAFTNFHVRSKKAKKILELMPSRAMDSSAMSSKPLPGQLELMKDFNEFQSQLQKEGFFNPAPAHVAYRVAEIVLMHIFGFYLLFHSHVALGVIVLGIVSGRCGWLMHEGGHYSLTGNHIDHVHFVWC